MIHSNTNIETVKTIDIPKKYPSFRETSGLGGVSFLSLLSLLSGSSFVSSFLVSTGPNSVGVSGFGDDPSGKGGVSATI